MLESGVRAGARLQGCRHALATSLAHATSLSSDDLAKTRLANGGSVLLAQQ